MSDAPPKPDSMDEVICRFLKAEEDGANPAPEEWLKQYPHLAPELKAFFDSHKQIQTMTAPLRSQENAEGDVSDESPHAFGDYELCAEIAHGAMGVVYRARQISGDRWVALKMLRSGRFAGQEELERFEREAQAAGRLEHPNIVPVYDVGRHEGRAYYAMQLVEGPSLCVELPRLNANHRAAAQIMAVIARAIHYAHGQGIIHRDMKPANILFDRDGTPLVTDFGLAKQTENANTLTLSGQIVGTAAYMAPEQAAGRSIGTATDIYALGAILYELLTGAPPFQATTTLELLVRVKTEEPVPPRYLNPNIPRNLQTICLKCLEKNPNRRYESAAAMATDLELWLAGKPIVAKPISWLVRAVRWTAMHAAYLAILAMAATLFISAALSLYRKEPKVVDLACTLIERGRYNMARRLLEAVVVEAETPEDVLAAEEKLRHLDMLIDNMGPSSELMKYTQDGGR